MMLDNRLASVKSLVRPGGVVADIGTDHALLVCSLVKDGVSPRAFACDINPAPLSRAVEAIERNGLSGQIQAVLTNGLCGLPLHEIDDVIIAGMGGDLIGEILLSHPQTRDCRLRFILQPMTKPERLRHALYKNGFEIFSETAVEVGRHIYTVMLAGYTGVSSQTDILFDWSGKLLGNPDIESARLLWKTARRLEKKAAGLREGALAARYAEAADIIDHERERRFPDVHDW